MTIQIPNVGTGFPADQTGDSPWLATKKLGENFSDTNNAASKLVGVGKEDLADTQKIAQALYSNNAVTAIMTQPTANANTLQSGRFYISHNVANSAGFWGILTAEENHNTDSRFQTARSVSNYPEVYARCKPTIGEWSPWIKYAFHGEDYTATSVKSGGASYKRGWRKLTASFGAGASTITKAHGVSNIAGVTVRATVSGVSYYANDARATHRFTIQTDGTNVIITKSADATALNGAALTIYIDEEL